MVPLTVLGLKTAMRSSVNFRFPPNLGILHCQSDLHIVSALGRAPVIAFGLTNGRKVPHS